MRGLSVLFSGNILVQLIAFLIMPIVTRIYAPEELGLYQFITTVALICSPFIIFSLNQAIVKEVDSEKRTKLFSVAVLIALCTSIFFSLTFLLVNSLSSLDYEISNLHFILLFLLMFLTSVFSLFQALALNENKYGTYTKLAIIQSLSSNTSKVILGLISNTSVSLLLSLFLGAMFSIFYVFKSSVRVLYVKVRLASIFYAIKKYKGFTVFFTFSAFIGIFINWYIVLVAPSFGGMKE
ncbi:MAG: oligosaccharide flippase family protein, partial [Campylobacterales bacterium]|nr:oligosaccharide flippase family protein [Campylobacterales bacterium]